MPFTLADVPIVGDVYKSLRGDPDAVKAAYDTQIAATKEQSEAMKQFLLGQKGQAQAIYAPLQHMFNSAYGTEGLQAPRTPQGTAGVGPLASMYGGR